MYLHGELADKAADQGLIRLGIIESLFDGLLPRANQWIPTMMIV